MIDPTVCPVCGCRLLLGGGCSYCSPLDEVDDRASPLEVALWVMLIVLAATFVVMSLLSR